MNLAPNTSPDPADGSGRRSHSAYPFHLGYCSSSSTGTTTSETLLDGLHILAARDRMLKVHPSLRSDAVHLASVEWDVDKVRKMLIRYQDRILYGSDDAHGPKGDSKPAAAVAAGSNYNAGCTSTTSSISTQTPRGSWATPIALRA
jgi:hypothetical protein